MGGKLRSSSRTKNSVLNLTFGFSARLFLLLMRFVTRTIFINTLGKSYLGINGLFSNILMLLSTAELGISTAIALRLYKPLAEEDDERTRLLLKFYRQAHRVIGCIIIILGLLLIPALPVLIKDYGRLERLGINATLIFILFLTQSAVDHLFFAYRSVIISADQKAYIADTVGIVVAVLNNIVQIAVLVF